MSKNDNDKNIFFHSDSFELCEQDRWLPIANVDRVMRLCLPENAKISKEAKECMQECVSEFISFITSQAAEKCSIEKRKTLNGEDILYALFSLGFENYAEVLRIYLAKYRVFELDEVEKRRLKYLARKEKLKCDKVKIVKPKIDNNKPTKPAIINDILRQPPLSVYELLSTNNANEINNNEINSNSNSNTNINNNINNNILQQNSFQGIDEKMDDEIDQDTSQDISQDIDQDIDQDMSQDMYWSLQRSDMPLKVLIDDQQIDSIMQESSIDEEDSS